MPRPSTAKCANDQISIAAPAPVSTQPVTWTGAGQAVPACQPVSHHGTTPATTLGAITRKAALPATAVFVRIGACPQQFARHRRVPHGRRLMCPRLS